MYFSCVIIHALCSTVELPKHSQSIKTPALTHSNTSLTHHTIKLLLLVHDYDVHADHWAYLGIGYACQTVSHTTADQRRA
jgi:hypothetical protein